MAGFFFELVAQVRGAAVIESPGDFAERQFAVGKPFFDFFNFLADDVSFDGLSGCGGEQMAQVRIFVAALFG